MCKLYRYNMAKLTQTSENNMQKPFAPSCDENRDVILQCIKNLFTEAESLLEIGSGTGQHAVYFAQHLSHLKWQPSDLSEQIEGMNLWFAEAALPQIQPPMVLDVADERWLKDSIAYVFTANTTHIMSWEKVQLMFAGIGRILKQGGLFAQYGPFNYAGKYTSESNARFDQWLKNRDPQSAIRNFEDVWLLAKENGLILHSDHEMPANNRILVWQKI